MKIFTNNLYKTEEESQGLQLIIITLCYLRHFSFTF